MPVMNWLPILAEGGFSGLDRHGVAFGAFVVFIVALCLAIVWWLGKMAFPKLGVPVLGLQIWDGFFILLIAVAVLNFLMGLIGHQFIPW